MITEDVLERIVQLILTIIKKQRKVIPVKKQKEKDKALLWHAKENSSFAAGLAPDLRDV